MPNFPEINPDITRQKALDMILASIAMEELGISHIINAEGEKIQYILKKLEHSDSPPSYDEIININKSVEAMLSVLLENQVILKSKMESVLDVIEKDIGPTGPTGPTGLTGSQGPKGQKGEPGEKGNDGSAGPIGPTGARGKTGIDGEVGATGPTGPRGPKGTPGSKCMKYYAYYIEGCSDYCWHCDTLFQWVCDICREDRLSSYDEKIDKVVLKPNKVYKVSYRICVAQASLNRKHKIIIQVKLVTSTDSIIVSEYVHSMLSAYDYPIYAADNDVVISTIAFENPVKLEVILISPSLVRTLQAHLTLSELE